MGIDQSCLSCNNYHIAGIVDRNNILQLAHLGGVDKINLTSSHEL